MVHSGLLCAAFALLVFANGNAVGEQVFRSIDADGNVTFSSSPPPPNSAARVDTITLPPGPTPEQQAAAEARLREIEAQTRRQAEERAARQANRASDADAARRNLEQAEQDLAAARERGDGDWQTLATGGRVPSGDYMDRVRQAEQRVQEAREALSQARR